MLPWCFWGACFIYGGHMKIKVREFSYDKVLALPERKHQKPTRPNPLLKQLILALSKGELKQVGFQWEKQGMEQIQKGEPCLVLMNHSSFIDLKIAETVMKDHPLNIICTSDGLVGKEWLMRKIGCIPTNKFVTDVQMVEDMVYALHTLKTSVLMFPEASYSFDGTATPIPNSLGKCVKLLQVPVVIIRTHGAFLRDPLYNNLQIRDVKVSAEVTCLFTKKEVAEKSAKEIQQKLTECFTFDNFKEQQEKHILVKDAFRADCLNRVLYQCATCGREGFMHGEGTRITCRACGETHELTEDGFLRALSGKTIFPHIPDWYNWQRQEVKKALQNGTYQLDVDVTIYILKNLKCIYKVGDGHLHHDVRGFYLEGCDGKLQYRQSPKASYSLYADYYWYEIGDMICIGNMEYLYYCFPKNQTVDVVAKTRLATEELYKLAIGDGKSGSFAVPNG